MIKPDNSGEPLVPSNIDELAALFRNFELKRGSRPKAILTSKANQAKIAAWFKAIAQNPTDSYLTDINYTGVPILEPRDIMII